MLTLESWQQFQAQQWSALSNREAVIELNGDGLYPPFRGIASFIPRFPLMSTPSPAIIMSCLLPSLKRIGVVQCRHQCVIVHTP